MKFLNAIIFFLFIFPETTICQDSGIPISIFVSKQQEDLNAKQAKRLGNKTKAIVNKNGLAATVGQQFILYPEFSVVEERTENMETTGPITLLEAEISFTLQQLNNGIIFNATTISVIGEGTSRERAISKAIGRIKTSNPVLRAFLAESKNKIRNYYQDNCTQIINEANTAADLKQYRKAIGLLYAIPLGTTCHEKSRTLLSDIYFLYQNQHCQEWVMKAKALIAQNEYKKALAVLAQIDPASSCESKVNDMISKTAELVDAEDRKMWDALQERYHNKVALEEMRIETIGSILTAYHQSRQSDTQQFIVIK